MNILVTGGAGFIGCNFTRLALDLGHCVSMLDLYTYAGHEANLESIKAHPKLELFKGDIADPEVVSKILLDSSIDVVVNFAAESHVDRSIVGPRQFIDTNIVGTFNMLDCSLRYWEGLSVQKKSGFKYVQISTDEVFGELGDEGKFSEKTPYAPNSPYSASKAGGDHLVRAWGNTYGLPINITNCSNNYGPFQFPEKLIPYVINCALSEKTIPVYGTGQNIRDWIFVEDHCRGVMSVVESGQVGETYCFGGDSERTNLEVVESICKILDEHSPRKNKESYRELISFVTDRKGHDWRYAIDATKAKQELQFKPSVSFENGLAKTVFWYLENKLWSNEVLGKGK